MIAKKVDPLLLQILYVDSDGGMQMAEDILLDNGMDIHSCNSVYTYAEGTIPVCLVAHVDTVHKEAPRKIYRDPDEGVLWSCDGLGADDRAGVYAIAHLLSKGYRPHVLFTDGEETGGWGAKEASFAIDPPKVNCLIEIDRMGHNDACVYGCHNKRWNKYLRRRKWSVQRGSYTDIADLMPAWGIAGANFSAGYYNNHMDSEYLNLAQLERTILRVEAILKDPPPYKYPYIPSKPQKWWESTKSTSIADDDLYPMHRIPIKYNDNWLKESKLRDDDHWIGKSNYNDPL